MAKAKSVIYQLKFALIGPIKAIHAIRPRLANVIYKVNWLAETFFQQHCMAMAKMPMQEKVYSTLYTTINA